MTRAIIEAATESFQKSKDLAERAAMQLSDNDLRRSLSADTNSVAVIMKHMGGNLRSRWTDFLTSDGEKPDRNRDDEFVDDFETRAAVFEHWERGWRALFDTLETLTDADLTRTITIRGEPHTVARAIFRALEHAGYHSGQIVQVARILSGDHWETLTIARGESARFNQSLGFGNPTR